MLPACSLFAAADSAVGCDCLFEHHWQCGAFVFPSDTPQWVKDQANDTGIVPEGYWYEVFGGCGAWSDESKDAIQHTEYCPGRNGGTVWIAEGSSDPTWVSLDESTGTVRERVAHTLREYGLPEGWYEWK